MGEIESLICNFYLSVAACTIVRADPSLRYTSVLMGRYATNKQPTNLPCNMKVGRRVGKSESMSLLLWSGQGWGYRMSAGTGLPSVSILCLGEIES